MPNYRAEFALHPVTIWVEANNDDEAIEKAIEKFGEKMDSVESWSVTLEEDDEE